MDALDQLGPRLRTARQQRGWTLEDLAGRAGMSTSTLSRLESGKRQASLELLLPLTGQLGIRIDDLLEQRARDPRVHRTPVTRGGMTIAPLTRQESDVRAFKITYRPGAPVREPQVHDGHEWIYVLTGELELTLGDQVLVLEPGEAAEFDTVVPHRMRAAGTKPAEVISIFNAAGERVHVHTPVGEADASEIAPDHG
ncbi:XRE family transcriptional regulator [Leucobacter albus]|uniref:XRE family transcriptional regulator n=1 Tax=Leucobacter albus TaxID=272210 RepID=A0ABW3TKU7_9MICO